jgi:hypothetical protein
MLHHPHAWHRPTRIEPPPLWRTVLATVCDVAALTACVAAVPGIAVLMAALG